MNLKGYVDKNGDDIDFGVFQSASNKSFRVADFSGHGRSQMAGSGHVKWTQS